jgi:c-di-GMP-related signal transduction protein
MDYNKEIFKGKSISDLMEEAYKDKQEKHKQLKGMISMLKDLINDGGDAVMMVPLIKDIMDLSIKNDDVLIRLLGIIQKIEASSSRMLDNSDGVLSEKDKQLLFESLEGLTLEN